MRALIAVCIGAPPPRLCRRRSIGLRAWAAQLNLLPAMLIFVYGTLRRGEHNHQQLGPAQYVGEAWTAPSYELVDLGQYPALLEAGADAVRGELYEVPDAWLAHLDAFEDVPSLYERKQIALSDTEVAGYVMRRDLAGAAPRISSGDWCAR